jgi:hypothetical protein
METATRRSAHRAAGVLLVAVGCVLFVAIGWGRISAPFGDSDEGINGAVWSLSASSLRTLGVVDSKLGGERTDGTEYATHPPGTVVTTAVAQAVGGARPWASRAPAWLATLAALVLLYRLARRSGFDRLVAGGATALVALTPMALVYGPMLDTPIVAFPFGVLVITCWFGDWQADADAAPDAGHAARIALAAALAGLFGWQAAVLTALCGLALAARALRHRPGSLRSALPYLLGGAIGVALSLSWSWWVYGDFHTLFDKFGGRSGESSGVGIGDMVSFQLPWLANLLGLSFVGLIGCLVALRDRALRPLAAMALASVAVYAVVFRQAAAGHQYWNFWVLLPTAVGWAYVLRAVVREVAGSRPAESARSTAIGAVVAIVVLVGAFGVLGPDSARDYIDEGHRAARLVDQTPFPTGQTELAYVGQPYRPDAWITYNTDLRPVPILSADQLATLAADQPEHLVLVLGACDDGAANAELCTDLTRAAAAEADGDVTRPRLVPAGALVGSPG